MFDVGHLLNNVLSTISYERRAKERKKKNERYAFMMCQTQREWSSGKYLEK